MLDPFATSQQIDWRTLVHMREIYGNVHTLIMRDMSSGNDLAEITARNGLTEAMKSLHRLAPELLTGNQVQTLTDILKRPEIYRPPHISWPLMTQLKRALEHFMPAHGGFDVSFSEEPKLSSKLKSLVISVGSNIGVGDEFLAARALSDRVSELPGLTLYVSSRRPDLWKLASKDLRLLLPPPFGALDAIDEASADERTYTGYCFLDFVDSDPFPDYIGPAGLAFAGKWIMGERRAEWRAHNQPGRIMVTPPLGAPQHREIELHYVTGKVVPGHPKQHMSKPAQLEKHARDGVFLQCLTSKNSLLFPPAFWAHVVAQASAILGQPFNVTISPGPTPGTAQQVARQEEAIAARIGANRVRVLPKPIFADIFDAVSKSAALLGPDTFTSHFATVVGTAQVSMIQPEHIAWVPSDAPIFFVESDAGGPAELASTLARRLAVAIGLPGSATAKEVRADAENWCRTLHSAWSAAHHFAAHGTPFDAKAVSEWSGILHDIYHRRIDWSETVMGCRYTPRYPPCLTFNPAAFANSTDLGWATVRWLQAIGLNEIDGALRLAARGH